MLFQFTRPQGARRRRSSRGTRGARFNSRARKGRDGRRQSSCKVVPGSIHAPARGATSKPLRVDHRLHVSIHAPARGATLTTAAREAGTRFQFTRPQGARQGFGLHRQDYSSFNSRARKGRDELIVLASMIAPVSIHAPARGATPLTDRPGRGLWFQFTRPQGARQAGRSRLRLPSCFNSRARKGRDLLQYAIELRHQVSIHAPARGATSSLTTPIV